MIFQIAMDGPIRPFVTAAVIAHGITDLDTPSWPLIYLFMYKIPFPPKLLLMFFCAASTIHFAEDSTIYGSFFVHSMCAILGKLTTMKTSFDVMFAYLTMIHTPLHYLRCWNYKRVFALNVAALTTGLLTYGFYAFTPNHIVINNLSQRIVLAHILCEFTHPKKLNNNNNITLL